MQLPTRLLQSRAWDQPTRVRTYRAASRTLSTIWLLLTSLPRADCRYAFVGFPQTSPYRLNTTPEITRAANYWSYILQLTYNPVLAMVKSSVLMLLLRIGGHQTGVKWTLYILNTANLLLMIATFLAATFQIIPIQAQWDPNVLVSHSINVGDMATATAAITIFTDVLVLCIPLWLFTGLQMRFAVKFGLLTVFLLSGV